MPASGIVLPPSLLGPDLSTVVRGTGQDEGLPGCAEGGHVGRRTSAGQAARRHPDGKGPQRVGLSGATELPRLKEPSRGRAQPLHRRRSDPARAPHGDGRAQSQGERRCRGPAEAAAELQGHGAVLGELPGLQGPSTLHPKFETLNHDPSTRNPEPETLNPKP